MRTFDLNTSLVFPIISIPVEIRYTDYKQPSGISYMLMVVLKESKDRSRRLADQLVNFGVPQDLHALFMAEIIELIRLQLIEMKHGLSFHANDFGTYQIDDFGFTRKGLRAFAEEAIPTEFTKSLSTYVYYDPMHNEFEVTHKEQLGGKEHTTLKHFNYEQFHLLDSEEIENVIDSYRGANGFAIGKKNILDSVNIQEQQVRDMYSKYDTRLRICTDGSLELTPPDSNYIDFIRKYYDAKIITDSLKLKAKFKFRDDVFPISSSLNDIDGLTKLHFPIEYEKLFQASGRLIVSMHSRPSKNYKIKPTDLDINQSFLNNLYEGLTALVVDNRDTLIGYMPIETDLKCNLVAGVIKLPFLAEIRLKQTDVKDIVRTLSSAYAKLPYASDTLSTIHQLCDMIDNYDPYQDYFKRNIPSNAIKALTYFNHVIKEKHNKNSISSSAIEWLDATPSLIEHVIENPAMLDPLITLYRYCALPESALFQKLSNNVTIPMEALDSFVATCETLGLHPSTIYNDTNICSRLYSALMSNKRIEIKKSKLAKTFVTIQECLRDLKTISEAKGHSFVVDERFDRISFLKAHNILKDALKSLKKWNVIDSEKMEELEERIKVFNDLAETFRRMQAIEQNPSRMTLQDAETMLRIGASSRLIIDLCRKLEGIFNNLDKDFKQLDLSAKIDKAFREDDLITSSDADILHRLRIARNNLVHATDNSHEMSSDALENAVDVLFRLEESI